MAVAQQTFSGSQTVTNTSGQGANAVVPAELQGLNWGGLLLSWIWGIGNSTWIALLTFVPFVGVFVPFYLLFKGNELAWRNKQWESVDAFKATQRKWAIAGLALIVIAVVLGILSSVLGGMAASNS